MPMPPTAHGHRRVLVVEDDPMLGDGIASGLTSLGFDVAWCRSGKAGDAALREHRPDAIVLDLGLPDGDGLYWLQWWREHGETLPILVLTARDALGNRIRGLDAGADDYLIKPLAIEELAARLRAFARRDRAGWDALWRHGDLAYSPASRTATWKGAPVEITTQEAALLEVLLAHPGRLLTRQQIQDRLYGWDGTLESNTLEVYVYRLRRKFSAGLVRTVRGVGYALGEIDGEPSG